MRQQNKSPDTHDHDFKSVHNSAQEKIFKKKFKENKNFSKIIIFKNQNFQKKKFKTIILIIISKNSKPNPNSNSYCFNYFFYFLKKHRDDVHEFSYDKNAEIFNVRYLFVLAPTFLILSLVWLMIDWPGFLGAKFRQVFRRRIKLRRSVYKSPRLRKSMRTFQS